jgi:pimeloyl-ACP methyl ester carboxylesterase
VLALLAFVGFALFCGRSPWVSAQTRSESQQSSPVPPAIDPEYRRLDELASLLRARNEQQYAFYSPNGISESSYVRIGGIEQWVTIQGQNRDNPVLLFLHGGPGDITSSWSFALFAPWERQFTVVQWDERGSGRTLGKNGPGIAQTITVDRIVQDGIELAEYLCKRLRKEKIIVVAHSFGSVLGLRMARAKPGLFYAYVGTGQVSDVPVKNYAATYEALLKQAKSLDDQRAIEELSHVGPPPYDSGEGYRVQWRWANTFEGATGFLYGTLGLALVAPGYSIKDLKDHEEGQSLSADRLLPELQSIGPAELGLKFSVPVFVFQGEEDFTTSTVLARHYVESIKAPRKEFVAIKGGGHFAVFMRSDQFLQELITRVRPLAVSH